MAIKAKYNGNYRKSNGTKVHTYVISGTPKEMEKVREVLGDQIVEHESGAPLFFFSDTINGRKQLAKPEFDLIITHGGKLVIDTTKADLARNAKLEEIRDQHVGRIMAEQEMGIGLPTTTVVNTPTNPEPATPPVTPENLLNTGNGATGATEPVIPADVNANAGTETIGS